MADRLRTKVTFITGAGAGMGREAAVLFAEEGARVVVADIDRAAAEETVKKVEAAGFSEVILYFNVGMKPHNQVKEEMDRFMREVAPNFEGKHKLIRDCFYTGQGIRLQFVDSQIAEDIIAYSTRS